MSLWLLQQDVLGQIERAYLAGLVPTAEQTAEHQAALSMAASGDVSRIMTTAGDRAEIVVSGVLTPAPDIMARIFGGGNTTYGELIAAIRAAESDPKIAGVDFVYATPGGNVNGLFDAVAEMQAMKKPTRAIVANLAASAGYALAAQAGEILANNVAAMVGSIGILARLRVNPEIVTITSSNAPNKAPDPTTEEGKAAIREELDALHEVFVDAIAKGRNVSADKVNSDFGRGSVLLADAAIKRGMVDQIVGQRRKATKAQTPTASGGNLPEVTSMDLATLQAQHPDVYAAAVKVGTDKERDRVVAHVTMGEASGDMKTALSAVKDGQEMTASLQAAYMAASMNRQDQGNRDADTEAADAAAAAAADTGTEGAADPGDAVAALVEQRMGIDKGEG